VLAGFAGVLVILGPGAGMIAWPALAAFLGASFYALNMLLVRQMGTGDEPVEAIGVAGNLLTLLATAPLLPPVWTTPDAPDLLLAAAAGTVAGCAFLLLAAAYRTAPAAIIAPFQYSQMLHGLLIGWFLFADRPSPRMLLGAAIIIASGLYILQREALRRPV
jgi:drug/metabolite transporter (DMT)-like permease